MNYEEIYKRLTNEDEKAKYPEAIDGGFGWRPVSGYRFIERDYPTTKWVGYWEDVFDCYDGWDSMDYRDQPTYVGKTKEEAVLGCYINELEAEVEEWKQRYKEERRSGANTWKWWQEESRSANHWHKKYKELKNKLEEK